MVVVHELIPAGLHGLAMPAPAHAKNKFAGRIIPFLVLGFWDKNTGIWAGMPCHRDFPATTVSTLKMNDFKSPRDASRLG